MFTSLSIVIIIVSTWAITRKCYKTGHGQTNEAQGQELQQNEYSSGKYCIHLIDGNHAYCYRTSIILLYTE